MLELLTAIYNLAPGLMAILAATVTLVTSIQAFLMLLSVKWPWAGAAARVLGVVAIDLMKVLDGLKKLFGAGKGVAKAGLVVLVALLLFCCTPAERAKLNVPVVSTIDAVGMQVAQVLGWCQAHGVDGQTLLDAKRAADEKDFGTALDLSRKILSKTAEAGEPVPKELVGIITTAEGALAAEGVQDGMRALSR